MEITENSYLKQFESRIFEEEAFINFSFEECSFVSCSFVNVDLSQSVFTSCSFTSCSFILTKFNDSTLNDVIFTKCRLMGLNLSHCNDFLLNINFEGCHLDNFFIADKKLQKTNIINCTIKDSDFMRINFKNAVFTGTVFNNVTFNSCNLEKADFRSAAGYLINPENNRLKQASFSLPEAESFLSFLDIRID